jgi:uncharacterized membrane protein YhhN
VNAALLATACAVCALLVAERLRSRAGIWLSKPLASLGFLLVAVLGAPMSSAHASALMLGLGLCAIGDVLLIPTSNGPLFLAGIGSFALGHLAYAVSFGLRGVSITAALVALAGMLAVIWATLRWLSPHLPDDMRIPVRVYMLIISAMVAAAVGSAEPRIAIGAIAFAASDLSVARERFVRPGFVNLAWGLPLYYAAQCLLAAGG